MPPRAPTPARGSAGRGERGRRHPADFSARRVLTGIKTGTTANAVIAALSAVANKLRAIVVADGPSAANGPLTTDASAISFRNDWVPSASSWSTRA